MREWRGQYRGKGAEWPLDSKKSKKSGKKGKKSGKREEKLKKIKKKRKNQEEMAKSLCPSWQIRLATLLEWESSYEWMYLWRTCKLWFCYNGPIWWTFSVLDGPKWQIVILYN